MTHSMLTHPVLGCGGPLIGEGLVLPLKRWFSTGHREAGGSVLRVCGQVQGENSFGAAPLRSGLREEAGARLGHAPGLCALCARRTETLRVVGQPSSSMGPWSGSSKEYSTEKATGFT